MNASLHILDQSPSGVTVGRIRLELVSESVSLREIIEARVRHEVARHNAAPSQVFEGLVQPTDTERTLNGYRMRRRRRIDADTQVERALAAFRANGFFVLVDGRQLEDLDARVQITDEPEVVFIKLVQLVGG